MTITRFCCGWETGNEQQWGGATGAADVTTGAALNGKYGLHMNPSAASAFTGRQLTGTTRCFVGRFTVHFPSLPTGTAKKLCLFPTGLGSDFPATFFEFDPADNKIKMVTYDSGGVATATSVGPVVAAATDYVIAFRIRGSSMDTLFDWSVDGVAQTQIASAGGIIIWYFGRGISQTYSAYFDDIAFVWTGDAPDQDTVSAMHPLPIGYVRRLAPVANGSNNNESSFTPSVGTIADTWQFLNDEPFLSTTSYVAQTTQGTGDYLGYTFESLDADEVPTGILSVVFAMRSDGLSANNAKVHLLSGATDELVYDGLWLSTSVSIQAEDHSTIVPATKAEVDALVARWGYSSDIISVPRLGALHLEVDVTVTPPVERGLHGALELNGLVLPVRRHDGGQYQEYGVLTPYRNRHRPHVIGRKRVPDE